MKDVTIACAQLTWKNVPEEQVLAEIALAGYAGAPAGPWRRSAQATQDFYGKFGLKPAPGYLGVDFWKPELKDEILAKAERQARFAEELGLHQLYVAAGFDSFIGGRGKTRKQVAAQVAPEDGLSDAQFRQFADTLNAVGELTLRFGVKSCFHNHVGTVIETRQEFERLLELCDPELLFLGPDTGHLAWGGADVVPFCRKYANRIETIHIKDIDAGVLERGKREAFDYDTFVKHGIFTELGQGSVDFPGLFQVLEAANFSGWIIVETDVTQRPTALESATISRNYLKSLGL